MSSRLTITLATPAGKADLPGKPGAATHILTYWPPEGSGLMQALQKRVARRGQWVIYTIPEFEQGDYCQGDRWLLEASARRRPADLAMWAGGQLGWKVALRDAGATKYGPAYWVLPG